MMKPSDGQDEAMLVNYEGSKLARTAIELSQELYGLWLDCCKGRNVLTRQGYSVSSWVRWTFRDVTVLAMPSKSGLREDRAVENKIRYPMEM